MKHKKLTRAQKVAMGQQKPVFSKYEQRRMRQRTGAVLADALDEDTQRKLKALVDA